MMRANVGMRIAVRCAASATTSDLSDHPVIFDPIANSDFAIAAPLSIAVMPPTRGGIAARSSVTRILARPWHHHRTHRSRCVVPIIPGNYCRSPWHTSTQQRLPGGRGLRRAPARKSFGPWRLRLMTSDCGMGRTPSHISAICSPPGPARKMAKM
jgi:hypothetical protein